MTDSLDQIAHDFHLTRARLHPLRSTVLGVAEAPRDRLPDISEEGEAIARKRWASLQHRLEQLPAESLTAAERTSQRVLEVLLRHHIEAIDLRLVETEVSASFVGASAALLTAMPKVALRGRDDAEAHLVRLAHVRDYLLDHLNRVRHGIASGRRLTRRALVDTAAQCRSYAALSLSEDPLLRPFAGSDAGVRRRAERLVIDVVRPAFLRMAEGCESLETTGRGDEEPGLCAMPDGERLYHALLRRWTTTTLGPEEIHRIGVDATATLAEEVAELGGRALGTRSPAEVFQRLREDPAMRFDDPAEAVAVSREVISRAAAAAGDWFTALPDVPCLVEPMPGVEAAGASVAYYQRPSTAIPHGTYWINTSGPVITRYECEAVAFHEGIPGHHTQLALQAQLDLPEFRRVGTLLAGYAEGWGLYAERLADEMGLYSSELARLGMVATDTLRACRLVVDTGLHQRGWTRQQAIEYMLANAPLTEDFVTAEVDRYIVMPGQACAYLLGRRTIVRLRQQAADALGVDFDLPAFHQAVLGGGQLPLDVLNEEVETWIAERVGA